MHPKLSFRLATAVCVALLWVAVVQTAFFEPPAPAAFRVAAAVAALAIFR